MFEQAEPHETLAGGEDGLFIRARRPAEDPPGLCIGGILVLSEFGQDLLYRGITKRREAHHPIGEFAGWNTFSHRSHAVAHHVRDLKHGEEITGDGEEALSPGRGIGHGAEMQVDGIANVDGAEIEFRQAG